MSKEVLGGFEHRVLLSALRLQPNAFTASIVADLEERTGREVALAAVYISLKRLEKKGLLRSQNRAREEGGETRARRYFAPTSEGLEVLREERDELRALWKGVEKELKA